MNKCKKTVVMILALLMLTSIMPSYGAAPKFTDVAANHWAYKDIEKMAELEYIAGIGNGKFDPNGTLTLEQALLLLSRLTNPTKEEKTSASYAYSSLLNELGVDNWAKEGLAVALYKEIITEAGLRNNKANMKKAINKLDTSVLLTKAMDLYEAARNKTSASLTYKDTINLTTEQQKCLVVLIEAGVLDPKGTGNGEFEPKSTLTRAVMAKMMATAYDYMQKNPTTPTTPTQPEPPKEIETEKVFGTVVRINSTGEFRFLIVDNEKGGTVSYQIMGDTVITVDGKTTTYSALLEGQEVELSLKKETNQLISIKAESVEEKITGKIKTLNSVGSRMTVEYIEDRKTVSKEFVVDSKAYIYLDGKSVNLKDLKEGDLVELEIKNNIIYDIEATSKIKDMEGTIKDISPVKDSRDDEYYITIVDDKDNSYKFLVNSKTTIYREDRRVDKADELKVKDEVDIRAEYDLDNDIYVVYDLDAYVVKKNIKGIIYELQTRYQEPTKVIIYNQETKKEESYVLGKDIYIRIDRIVSNSYDLKIGYYVEVVTEGDEITEIEADSAGVQSTMIGRILSLNTRSGRIELEIQNFSFDGSKLGEEITIYASDANIIHSNGTKLDFDSLYRGDTINVIGNYDGSTFIAKTVMLLK